jgi:hypothetical protein
MTNNKLIFISMILLTLLMSTVQHRSYTYYLSNIDINKSSSEPPTSLSITLKFSSGLPLLSSTLSSVAVSSVSTELSLTVKLKRNIHSCVKRYVTELEIVRFKSTFFKSK